MLNNLQMWPSLIAKAKAGGLDVIETLVFWNLHEPQPEQVAINNYNVLFLYMYCWAKKKKEKTP